MSVLSIAYVRMLTAFWRHFPCCKTWWTYNRIRSDLVRSDTAVRSLLILCVSRVIQTDITVRSLSYDYGRYHYYVSSMV